MTEHASAEILQGSCSWCSRHLQSWLYSPWLSSNRYSTLLVPVHSDEAIRWGPRMNSDMDLNRSAFGAVDCVFDSTDRHHSMHSCTISWSTSSEKLSNNKYNVPCKEDQDTYLRSLVQHGIMVEIWKIIERICVYTLVVESRMCFIPEMDHMFIIMEIMQEL